MNRSTRVTVAVLLLAFAAVAQAQKKPDTKPTVPGKPPAVTPPPAPPPAPPPTGAPAPAPPGAPTPTTTTVPPPGGTGAPAAPGSPGQPPPGVVGGPNPADVPGEENDLYHCKKYPPNVKIKVALKPDTDLKELVAWVMGFTCRSFLYGNAISGRANKVTLIAPAEMTPPEAYRLFLVALQSMGLTVVPKGNTLEIVETTRSKEVPVPVYRGRGAPNADQVVRVILRPEHISVEDLTNVLNAMRSVNGVVTPLPNSGVVMVTDFGSSIDRMVDVLRDVDAATGAEKIWVRQLIYADAQQMASMLAEIFGVGRTGATGAPGQPRPPAPGGAPAVGGAPGVPGGAGGAGGEGRGSNSVPSKIIPDQRTNSLILIASDRAYARVKPVIDRLDTGSEGGTGTIHVYPLNNSDAEELATVLNALISGQPQRRPGQPGQPGAPPVPSPAVQPGGTGSGGTPAFEGQIKITHDKTSNSLVIISSAKDFLSLRDTIKKLDVPRRQVFVEAAILEVTLDTTRKIGTAYHAGDSFSLKNSNDSIYFGGVESNSLNSFLINPSSISGLFGGIRGPEFPGLSIPSIGLLFQVLQANNNVDVLSAPNLLTTNNEQAEITVGQNIPFQSSAFGGLGGLPIPGATTPGQTTPTTPFPGFGLGQSISRQDLALKLTLKPHVNESDYVRIELEQEISDLLTENFGGGLGPSWSKRHVKTMIVVKDQQPVVIGGLMSDKTSIDETKVPLLGDIPILGYLFKFQQKKKQKTNLLIVLTPYIIKDQSDLQRIFERKVRERRDFITTYTSFEARELEVNIDYRRKHGLLEDINKAIQLVDDDEKLYQDSQQQLQRRMIEGPVDDSAAAPAAPPPPAPPAPAPAAPPPGPKQ
jgi:general secretion pathway protein D